MNKHIIILTMLMSVIGAAAIAQTGIINGTVVDAETKRPLEGANVILLGKVLGTTTTKDGTFTLFHVPIDEHTLQVSYIGYTTTKKSIILNSDSLIQIEIRLQPAILPGQTVVVTATRGKERETPITFATLTAKDLAKRYSVQDVPQLLSELPSTIFYSDNGNGIGYNYLNIRGFDQKRISVMVNGIPQNDPEDHDVYWLDFPDLTASLEDVQVQRGAGSSFYGPPAIGGSVNLITTSYSRTPGVNLYSGYGSYNTRKFSVSVNSGLVNDKYLFFGRLGKIASDGYREQSWTDFSSYFLSAVRFDETMTTQVNFYGGPVADHLAYYGISKADAYSSDANHRRKNPIARSEEIENFSQPHYELLHEWRMAENFVLSNTLFLVTGDGFFDYDGSWAPYSYYRITPSNGFVISGDPDTLYIPNALIRANVSNVQYGWLPRVSYDHGNGRVTAGAEIRIHRSLHWGALRWGINVPVGVTPDYHYYEYRGAKDILSLYAQESYRIGSDLTFLFNLQYVYNKYRLSNEKYLANDFSVPYNFLNPKIGANYNITDELNVYSQISYTSREPRLKNLYDAAEASNPVSWERIAPQFDTTATGTYDFSKPLVQPEHLTNIELGFGYTTDHVHVGINFYYMDFKDEIIKKGTLDRFGQPVTGNADKTLHQGIEVTARVLPCDNFELQGNATLSRNRLEQYSDYSGGNRVTLDGNAIAGFPEFLANLRAQYSLNGLTLGIAMQHVGEFYTDNFQKPSSPNLAKTVDARTIWNSWLSYELPISSTQSIEIQIQMNNVFDLVYASHGEGDDFFPAADRNFFASIKVNL
jgi:iron complex outermembrane recepter protein